jgi:hypothetical protein
VAYADLGGLGSKQGVPAVYDWAAASAMPQLLPWLVILGLLLLKLNRCASAWWILAPLGCVAGLASAARPLLAFLPSSKYDLFLELPGALGFGLAAAWLLSSYLGWKHRLLAFLGFLLALGGFSGLAFACTQGWEGVGIEMMQMGLFIGVSALVISVAVSLAGLVCRKHYGWLRLSLWQVAALAVVWLLVLGPIFVIEQMMNRGNAPVMALLAVVGVATGITFGTVLPFLVLSFANQFYRERLKALLHLGDTVAPPVITPSMPTEAVAVTS